MVRNGDGGQPRTRLQCETLAERDVYAYDYGTERWMESGSKITVRNGIKGMDVSTSAIFTCLGNDSGNEDSGNDSGLEAGEAGEGVGAAAFAVTEAPHAAVFLA